MTDRSLNAWWPAFLWAACILYLSTKGGVQLPHLGISPDKIGHFGAYFLLGWFVLAGLKKTGRQSRRTALLAMTGVSLYGVLLEAIQWAFFPHRYFEVWDMIANITGAFLSCYLFSLFNHKT
ncbi:MAG TPA: hypothetical protein ENJ20_04225 [Bacteroidetes bacterium]|nr:hypothetical protein [Bacteroidota bacterium]